jgi:diguanylate cyclase (GGDEF)-like protein
MLVLGVPASILAATWYLIPHIAQLTPERRELIALSPYLITVVGIFLSIHFHRGRPFMALLLLILFYWVSQSALLGKPLDISLNEIFQMSLLLIPVNIALIAIMRERGIFTTTGRLRLIFLALQALVVYGLFHYNYFNLLPQLPREYNHLHLFGDMTVPDSSLVIGACAFILTAALAFGRQSPIDGGLLGAMTAFFIAGNWLTNRDIHSAFCASGAAIVTLSIMRDTYNMAFRDELTGLRSRRSLNERLHGLGRRYTIAMVDVDHFKKFNDTYGHDVGDQVLRMVARKLMNVGGGGTAFRYGGEEFTILFPGNQARDAVPYLEEVRLIIADYQLAIRTNERPKNHRHGSELRGSNRDADCASVSISIGVAERTEELTTPDAVMKAADRALYKAKNRGRNQVAL